MTQKCIWQQYNLMSYNLCDV